MSEDSARGAAHRLRYTALPLLIAALVIALAGPAPAAPRERVIVLPGATSAEGIGAGAGSTFYAGDLLTGDIYRGDVRRGTAELFIDAPAGRHANGIGADVRRGLLFVAGGFTGEAYVYNLRTGAPLATYRLGPAGTSDPNDVVVTPQGAWITDQFRAQLYFVPVTGWLRTGPSRTLPVTGPAAELSGEFNLNGITATPGGRTLVVAHQAHGRVYTVDATTGASRFIAGTEAPGAADVILRGRDLWVVQNEQSQVSRYRVNPRRTHGTLTKVIQSENFAITANAALFGNRLAVVNTHFDTGFPPTHPTYEIVVVKA